VWKVGRPLTENFPYTEKAIGLILELEEAEEEEEKKNVCKFDFFILYILVLPLFHKSRIIGT
jgi:hypothetical protein